jgi:hypothetical protein
VRSELADLSSGFDTVEFGQPDIEQNQVRLQFPTLLDCFQSIRSLADDLPRRVLLQKEEQETPPGLGVVHDENAHSG